MSRHLSRLLNLPAFICTPLVLLLLAAPVAASEADDAAMHNWPQWRGPLPTAVAPHADPPTEWSETKNVRWKVPVPGSGLATPAVWGDQLFVMTSIPTSTSADERW